MSTKNVSSEVVVGIDVSKDKVDVCILSGEQVKYFSYHQDSYDKMANIIARHKPRVVVLEPSGGYERGVLAELRLKHLPVSLVNPAKSRNFARAIGYTAKTDKLDAQLLARYGHDLRPEPMVLSDSGFDELKELAVRRRQLIKMQVMETNRYQQTFSARARRSVQDSIEHIERLLAELDDSLDSCIGQDEDLSRKHEILTSIKGVGPQTARVLIVHMPELGTLSKGQAASLAGLAPFNRDSGMWRGQRTIKGGRLVVRCALYMATISAIRYNPIIRTCYNRLKNAGKPFKVAAVACMRKLIIIANACLRKNQTFTQITA